MNKRQKKKAFKKKYGVNPAAAAKMLERGVKSSMQQIKETINLVCKRLPEAMDELHKQIREAAEQMNTDDLKEYLQKTEENRNKTLETVIQVKGVEK